MVLAATLAVPRSPAQDTPSRATEVRRLAQQADSLRARAARAESLYISILEKTNHELSLRWNPYGLFVSALGVLFAIAAIVVGVLLFRQSREYRQLIQDSIGKYETIVQALIQDRLDQMQVQVDKLLSESKEALKTATAKQREVIEKRIVALEKKSEEIKQTELPKISFSGAGLLGSTGYTKPFSPIEAAFLGSGTTINLGLGGSGIRFLTRRTCSHCGKEFDVPDTQPGVIHVGGRDINCPHCGSKIHLNY
jgi:DNA-directed RNA polymerase subunit RPC12/RpoP